MYLELMPPEAKPEDPLHTTNIMTYELGSVVRCLVYTGAVLDEKRSAAHVQSARIELADLITQCYVLAEQMGWKRLELENDGMERFRERMGELAEGTL